MQRGEQRAKKLTRQTTVYQVQNVIQNEILLHFMYRLFFLPPARRRRVFSGYNAAALRLLLSLSAPSSHSVLSHIGFPSTNLLILVADSHWHFDNNTQ